MIEQQITESLTQLSNNLGVPNDQLLDIVLLQAKVQTVKALVLLLMMVVMWFAFYKITKIIASKWDNLSNIMGFLIIGVSLITLISLTIISDLSFTISQLLIDPSIIPDIVVNKNIK